MWLWLDFWSPILVSPSFQRHYISRVKIVCKIDSRNCGCHRSVQEWMDEPPTTSFDAHFCNLPVLNWLVLIQFGSSILMYLDQRFETAQRCIFRPFTGIVQLVHVDMNCVKLSTLRPDKDGFTFKIKSPERLCHCNQVKMTLRICSLCFTPISLYIHI